MSQGPVITADQTGRNSVWEPSEFLFISLQAGFVLGGTVFLRHYFSITLPLPQILNIIQIIGALKADESFLKAN